MQELRQRFDKPTDQDDVPVQPVQKEEQKEQLGFFQRKEAFWEECQKRLGCMIHSLTNMFKTLFLGGILGRLPPSLHLQSATELLNDRKKFPKVEWCDRPSSQYNCSYGCQHTKSCEAFFEFSPEYMKHITKVEASPTFSTKKSNQENMEECDEVEKCKLWTRLLHSTDFFTFLSVRVLRGWQ